MNVRSVLEKVPSLLAMSSNSGAADVTADRPFVMWLLVRLGFQKGTYIDSS